MTDGFYVYCYDGRSGDTLCCPYFGCHWEWELPSCPEIRDMVRKAQKHLEEKHNGI